MTILVVEDDPACLVALTLILENEGYQVETAEHGLEALEVLERTIPGLILLDLWMPKMDGWQFLLRVRQPDHAARGVPVIALTADPRDHRATLPVEAILTKPTDLDLLLSSIRRIQDCRGGLSRHAGNAS